jgi:hypothetical protein
MLNTAGSRTNRQAIRKGASREQRVPPPARPSWDGYRGGGSPALPIGRNWSGRGSRTHCAAIFDGGTFQFDENPAHRLDSELPRSFGPNAMTFDLAR